MDEINSTNENRRAADRPTIAIVVLFLDSFGKKGFYQSQEFGLADAFAKAGYPVEVYRCTKDEPHEEDRGYPVYYPQVKNFGTHALFRPEKLFRKHYDVVIAFSDTQLIVPRLHRYCEKQGTLLIPYVGNTESMAYSMNMKKRVMDLAFRFVALRTYRNDSEYIFCKSYDTIRRLTSMGVPPEKLVFTPVGLNRTLLNNEFTPEDIPRVREEMGYSDEDLVLIFVGRMNNEKRPVDMFRILERLEYELAKAGQTQYKNVKLILIGDGILADQVQDMADVFGDYVRYYRKVPYEEMWKYYAAADRFVNLWDQEIFGMAIMEAIYYLTPAFLISAPGPRVISEGMDNAFLCDDIDEITKKILDYDYNPDSLLEDRQRLIDRFSWERFVDSLEDKLEAEKC